jgi:hypothetical protein
MPWMRKINVDSSLKTQKKKEKQDCRPSIWPGKGECSVTANTLSGTRFGLSVSGKIKVTNPYLISNSFFMIAPLQ